MQTFLALIINCQCIVNASELSLWIWKRASVQFTSYVKYLSSGLTIVSKTCLHQQTIYVLLCMCVPQFIPADARTSKMLITIKRKGKPKPSNWCKMKKQFWAFNFCSILVSLDINPLSTTSLLTWNSDWFIS